MSIVTISKKKLHLLVLLTVLIVTALSTYRTDSPAKENPKDKLRAKLMKPDILIDQKYVGVNNWKYFLRNNGSYMYDRDHGRPGGEFPRGSNVTVVFAGGFYIATIKDSIPVCSDIEFSSDYQPGKIINSNVPFSQLIADTTNVIHTYVIDRSQAGSDYANWPGLRQGNGQPALVADAQTWNVLNDRDTSRSTNRESIAASPNPGLGIEVTFESFAFATPPMNDVVLFKMTIDNKTNIDYPLSYIGLWMDADVDGDFAGNDIVGCDTARGLGYTYNADNTDLLNDGHSRCIGFDFFQGPVANTSEIPIKESQKFQNNQTVLSYDAQTNAYIQTSLGGGDITLGATSWTSYISSTDPNNNRERYYLMAGKFNDGSPKYGYGNGDYYCFRGDPITQQGSPDVATSAVQADQRVLLGAGPFTMKSGVPQEIWFGVVGGIGVDRLDAVSNMFKTDDLAQNIFTKGLTTPIAPDIPNTSVTALDQKVVISWQNNSEYTDDAYGEIAGVTTANGFTADYIKHDFEGYRVYRSLTGLEGSFTLLAQYDKVDQFGIVNAAIINSNANLEIKDHDLGSNTGLRYSFTDSNLTNGRKYFYAVTSYDAQPYIAGPDSFDYQGTLVPRPSGIPITLESSIDGNIFSAVPSRPISSLQYTASLDSNQAIHIQGQSDGVVELEVVDPSKVTGDRYKIEFFLIPAISNGKTLVGLVPDTLAYRVMDSTKNVPVPFSSKSDDPATFYDANSNGIFDAGVDSAVDDRFFSTAIADIGTPSSYQQFDIIDGVVIKVFEPSTYFKSVQYLKGPQFTAANMDTAWWQGCFQNFGDQEFEDLAIGSADNGMTPFIVNFGFPAQNAGGVSYNRNVQIVFSRDSTKWQYIYSTTGGSGGVVNYVRVPFRVFETDPVDGGNITPRQLNGRIRDRNTAGGNSQGWGLYMGGNFGTTLNEVTDDGLGPQTRGFLFVDTSSYDLGGKSGHYGTLAGTEKLYPIVNYFSSPTYAVWTPAPRKLNSLSGTNTDGFKWNLTCRSTIGGTSFNQGTQGFVYRLIPDEGTIDMLVTHLYSAADQYTFITKANTTLSKSDTKRNLKNIKVVPNPFYIFSKYDTGMDKLVKFTNLPDVCTIRIFTVSGDIVKIIHHNSTSNNDRISEVTTDSSYIAPAQSTSTERWDLRNVRGHLVASGLYIALIESNVGNRTVKFAVIQ